MTEELYTVIRSRRKTLALEIRNGKLTVRAPLWATRADILRFVEEKRGWIDKHLRESREKAAEAAVTPKLTAGELRLLAEKALQFIPERVRFWAPVVGVTYGRITIRNQRTRWGSCSAKGNLNFNCLLMLTPPEVIDSVIVHELCHRKEMNHSSRFYAEVCRVFPDYDRWNRWLKKNGRAILNRME